MIVVEAAKAAVAVRSNTTTFPLIELKELAEKKTRRAKEKIIPEPIIAILVLEEFIVISYPTWE